MGAYLKHFESGCFITEGVALLIQDTNVGKHQKPRSGHKHAERVCSIIYFIPLSDC